MTLALALVLLLAGLDPCAGASPACREAAEDALRGFRLDAASTHVLLAGCEQRLAARTPTITIALVSPVVAPSPPASGPSTLEVVGVLAAGVLLGGLAVAAGVVAAHR